MQEDDLVGYGIMVALYGGLLGWLFYLVRRHTHPSRSLVLSYVATLAIIVTLVFAALVVAIGIASATGNTHSPSKAIVGVGVGGVLGAVVFGWQYCRNWLSQEKLQLRTGMSLGVNRWQIVGAAVAVAVIGFLSIHEYAAGPGFIWNVIHAKIYVTHPCDTRPGSLDFTDLAVRDSLVLALWRGDCGVSFPYSALLAAVVGMAAIALLWPRYSPHEPAPSPLLSPGPPPIPHRGPPPVPPSPPAS